jgi:acylphosphatase
MANHRRTVLARVSGRVQGVSFRWWTRMEAEKLHLDGWVRNEDDGSVTALISGPEPAVSTMVERLWIGPPGALVSDVSLEEQDHGEAPSGFRITG